PPLFVKCHFDSAQYIVQLTDLGKMWEERLGSPDIVKRALEKDTSIDPSEDAQQFKILLDNLQNAIAGTEGTSRQLACSANVLTLRLSAPLPAPLDAVQWDVHLRPCTSQALSRCVVQPLLDASLSQKSHIDDLVKCLNAKDHVISKLLDKLETAGMDASSIFPGAAGLKPTKHATVRDQAGRYVSGLSPFDERQWR
ncbi:XLF-domain-containing protein, partial [Saccharata proteae CBS 121410]